MSALLRYFGWRGGTIHQLAKETGVDWSFLLYGQPFEADRDRPSHLNHFSHGKLAAEAMGPVSRRALVKEVQGDRQFWLGVAFSDNGQD